MSSLKARDFYLNTFQPIRHRGKSVHTVNGMLEAIRLCERYWRSLDPARSFPVVVEQGGKMVEALPEMPLDFLTDENVGRFLLARGGSPATRNKQLRYLLALANEAARRGYLAKPLTLLEETEPKRKPRCWTLDELERLIAVIGTLNDDQGRSLLKYKSGRIGESPASYWWLGLIMMIYNTGVRISATMSIRSEDLDLVAGRVLVRAETQKDKEDQEFSLIPETIAALQLIHPEQRELVFGEWPHDRDANGQPQRHIWHTLTDHLAVLLKAAGLPTTRKDKFHKIRRTFCTQVTSASDIEVARELMGHSTQQVTKGYVDERFIARPNVAAILSRPKIGFQLRLLKDDDPPPAAKVG